MAQPSLALAQKVIGRASKAGLPAELVPDELRTVHIGVDHSHGGQSAEDVLRRRVLDFVTLVRNAEVSAHRDGVAPGELTPIDWIEHWGLRL